MLVTFFPFSSANTGNSIQVKADSNDRRRTWIQLSQGKQTTEIDDIQNIGVEDLRVIALYLSNYYTPFSTILNGTSLQYKTSDGAYDEEEMTAYQTNMTNALVNDLGFDKEAAQFLVSQTVNYTLKTAHFIYMTEGSIQWIFDLYGYKEDDKTKKGIKRDESICAFNYSGREDHEDIESVFYLSDARKYLDSLDSVTAHISDSDGERDEKLYAVTYPIFLAALNAGFTEVNQSYYNYYEGCDDKTFGFTTSDPTLIDFYYVDTSNVAHTVFSNTDADVISYLLSNNELDYKNGLGNGFITVTQEYLKENASKINLTKVIAPYQYIYVDWVGDLILDIGTGQLVLLPGCMNNHVFGYIDKSLQDNDDQQPLILANAKAIYDMQEGHIKNPKSKPIATTTKLVGIGSDGKEYTVYTYEELKKMLGANGKNESAIEKEIDGAYHKHNVQLKQVADTGELPVYLLQIEPNYFSKVGQFLSNKITVADTNCVAVTDDLSDEVKNKKISQMTLPEFWQSVGALKSTTITSSSKSFIIYLDDQQLDTGSLELYLVREVGGKVDCLRLFSGKFTHSCKTEDSTDYACMVGKHLTKTVDNPIKETDFKYGCADSADTEPSSSLAGDCNGGRLFCDDGYSAETCGIGIAYKYASINYKNNNYRVPQLVINNGLSDVVRISNGSDATVKLAIQGKFQIEASDGTVLKCTKEGISLGGKKQTYYTKDALPKNVKLTKVEEREDKVIMSSKYQYEFKVGADTLIGCRYWTTALASNDKKFDKSKGWGTSDTMQTVYDYMDDNGFTCADGKNEIGFPYFNFWLSARCSKTKSTTTAIADTVRQKYKNKYVTADLLSDKVLTMSEVLFYDNLEEVNEDTTLCGDDGLFKAVDVYGVATGKNAEVDKSSLQSTSIFKTTAFDSAIESISGGGNSKLAPCLFYTYVFGYFNNRV